MSRPKLDKIKKSNNLDMHLDKLLENHWKNGTQDFHRQRMTDDHLRKLLTEKGIEDVKKFLGEWRGIKKVCFLAVNKNAKCILETRSDDDKDTFHLPSVDLTETESAISGVRRRFQTLTGMAIPPSTPMPRFLKKDKTKPPRNAYLLSLPWSDEQIGWDPDVGHHAVGHHAQAGVMPA